MVLSLLIVSLLQTRGLEHEVLVACDLCFQHSSPTPRGTREWNTVNTVATAEFGYLEDVRSQLDILWGGHTGSSSSCQLPCVLQSFSYDIFEQMWLSSPSELSAQLQKQF